ncbi:hypothetical protein [Xenorhabdus lircayensis]|uniref:Uncharacterized protein n=1 Tax=Xenorhabdus lircayensis TaxID=2763499 RepID=A0ABS0U2X3_9GAMM|nr:hypothetical protein [Xenorhabdus lircayensis]MBI6548231.1 hypothetical protein [Xenorhabdus lircayensis]
MVWGVNDAKAMKKTKVETYLLDRYDRWVKAMADGFNPEEAADSIGGADYELLRGTPSGVEQYTIRLNNHHRVSFTLDRGNEIVNVIQIGGHP